MTGNRQPVTCYPMARFRVVLRFDTDDGSFASLSSDALHDALCRAYPLLRYYELAIEEFAPLDDAADTCPRCGALPHLGVCG